MPSTLAEFYGCSLRLRRESKGWSQQQVAQWLGFENRASIHKFEVGEAMPSAEKLVEIARLFEVSVSDMLGDSPKSSKDSKEEAEIRQSLSAILMMLPAHQHRQRVIAYVLDQVSRVMKGETSELIVPVPGRDGA